MAKNKIPNDAIEKAYHLAKKVYNREMRQVDVLGRHDISDSSLKDYIGNYKQIKKGKCYQRTMNPFASEYYLQNILNDDGYEGLSKALNSMKKHLEYKANLQRNASPQHEIRKIYDKYKRILDNALKQDDLLEEINQIQNDESISKTDKETLIKARIGQGKFREDVIKLSKGVCRVTGLNQPDLLIASHIKPWRDSTNDERLDGYNGLLLSPHIDKLFDKGYISFQDNGDMQISEPIIELADLWNIKEKNVGEFSPQQQKYLKEHREKYFFKK